jgi:hypothetical protein
MLSRALVSNETIAYYNPESSLQFTNVSRSRLEQTQSRLTVRFCHRTPRRAQRYNLFGTKACAMLSNCFNNEPKSDRRTLSLDPGCVKL